MKNHVWVPVRDEHGEEIDGTAYPIDTPEQIETAQAALREAGLESAPVYAGEPDGTGDSYRTGATLSAQ